MAHYPSKNVLKSVFIICYGVLTLLLATYGTSSLASAFRVQTHLTNGASSRSNPFSIVRYRGKGYSFLHDSTWQETPDGNNGVSINHDGTRLDVFVQRTDTPISALQFEFGTLASVNCSQVAHMPKTAVIYGITWNMARYMCASPLRGHSSEEIVTLDTQDAIGDAYYSIAAVARRGALDKHAFKSIASFRFE